MADEDISRAWILEQFTKIYTSIREDVDKIKQSLNVYVTHSQCQDRRLLESQEIRTINERLLNIDVEVEKIKDSFDKKFSSIRMWIWVLMGGIIGELVMLLIKVSAQIKL